MMRKQLWSVLLITLLLGLPAAEAAKIDQVRSRIGCTTGEAITVGQPIVLKSDGLCYKADADDSTLRPAIGIAGNTAGSAGILEVVTAGQVGGLTALTKGGLVYLSTTAGGTTQTKPSAYVQVVGQAISATQYSIAIGKPAAKVRVLTTTVENLAANADIGDGTAANARVVWAAPHDLTISDVKIYSRASVTGLDGSNTTVVKIYNGTSTVATGTYTAVASWPANFTPTSVGTVSNAAVTTGATIRFDVVNGTAADLAAFDLIFEYTADE
jgi:hypothetical protein